MAAKGQKSGKAKAGARPRGSAGAKRSPKKRAKAKPGPDTADRLAEAIDEATVRAQESVTAYAKLAKDAAVQLTGDDPTEAGAWLQFTARSYVQAATDTAKALIAYNDVLKILANQVGPKPDG